MWIETDVGSCWWWSSGHSAEGVDCNTTGYLTSRVYDCPWGWLHRVRAGVQANMSRGFEGDRRVGSWISIVSKPRVWDRDTLLEGQLV